MVKDFFVDFQTFIAQVQAVEGAPIEFYMTEWALSLYKTESPIVNRFFMPYPYHHPYLTHIFKWNSQRESIKERYQIWFTDQYHKMTETKNYDDYGKVPIPFIYDLDTQPTWDQFFNDRIKPFIDSSIDEDTYVKYEDALVYIGLDRNTCAIVPNDRKSRSVENGMLTSATDPNNKDDIKVSLLTPTTEKLWIMDFPSNKYISMGDCEYTVQYPDLLFAMQENTGNIYLFDGENIE